MKLIWGDSTLELKQLPANSVDSIVTDPPYGISFMAKKWDYDVPSVELWKEALRVLKPGGHILCACGTRTQHRMCVNIEDAGFEIRDIVAWIYGSGFPKSHNIGKSVDKLQGNERDNIKDRTGAMNNSENSEAQSFTKGNVGFKTHFTETKGSSPYEGWGTALKPAMELWTLARKPLSEKTIAQNVLKHGTGGINIDECRVGTTGARNNGNSNGTVGSNSIGTYGKAIKKDYNMGRFPANLIHDGSDEVVGLFPNTKSGQVKEGYMRSGKTNHNVAYADLAGHCQLTGYGDSGSASRFFYCAKASKSERNRGLEGFEEKKRIDYGGFHSEKGLIENNRNPESRKPSANNHPTVKPIALMRYLCRLITPKGGTILDPFMGSGSTGIGAKLENFNFIGIELDEDYFNIAKSRIENYIVQTELFNE